MNLGVDAARYPPAWQWVLGSLDAGIQEESTYRFFLMTLIAWIGGRFWRCDDGRPKAGVFWAAAILSAVVFGWAHAVGLGVVVPVYLAAGPTAGFLFASGMLVAGLGYWRYLSRQG